MLSYKTKNNFWKVISFLIILGILYIGYALIRNGYSIEKNHNNDSQTVTKDSQILNLKYNIILKDSVFEGINKSFNAYTIKAEQAIKDSDNKYKLDIINAVYGVNESQSVTIFAKEGFLNEESNMLDLKNDVKLYFEDVVFNTSDARIDLVKKIITGNSSATLFYKNSHVTSDSFNTQNDNNIIIFNGNVSTIIDLSDY